MKIEYQILAISVKFIVITHYFQVGCIVTVSNTQFWRAEEPR